MHENWLIYLLPGPTDENNDTLFPVFESQSDSQRFVAIICKMSDRDNSSLNPSSSGASASETGAESRKVYYAKRGATRVYLFEAFNRWRDLKEKHGLDTDSDVARMLLDAFDANTKSPEQW